MFTQVHLFRVLPGKELLNAITDYCHEHKISSGVILGVIGSVQDAQLNFLTQLPGRYEPTSLEGPLEIASAQGSVALKDEGLFIHLHAVLSNQDICLGGHLARATIFSTAEVAIGELAYQLYRQYDDYTGLNELTC